ncbi:MAG: M81 family metallopeptidase [Chloroflexi bacterium]|nr:M81 family metallopeptidase [Chloroflexota bacterium]
MHLAILSMWHQTSTFRPCRPSDAQFEKMGIRRGDEVVCQFGASQATIVGFLPARERPGVEMVPVFCAHRSPMGTITRNTFDRLTGEMLHSPGANGP